LINKKKKVPSLIFKRKIICGRRVSETKNQLRELRWCRDV